MIVTEEHCKDLATKIRTMRGQDSFYKYKLAYHRIAHATGLPQGSLDYYIAKGKLPTYRYALLSKYVDEIELEHKTWIENPKPPTLKT